MFFFLFMLLKLNLAICCIFVPNVINPVHSIMFFILAVANLFGILLLLKLSFLAFVFFVVYIGAISVLFLFIVMLLDIKVVNITDRMLNYYPIGLLLLFAGLFLILKFVVSSCNFIILNLEGDFWFNSIIEVSDLVSLAYIMYDDFFLLFLSAGVLLLVAMVASIVLTLQKRHLVVSDVVTTNLRRSFHINVIDLAN